MSQLGLKKILFCDNSLRELINFREDIINYYAKQGLLIVLVAPMNRDYTPIYKNIKIYDVKMSRSGMNPFSDLLYLFRLMRIYRRERPNYIFHYTIKPNIYGSFVSRLLSIPSTAMIAGLGYVFTNDSIGSRIARLLYKVAMRCSDKVLVLNQYNHDLLINDRIVEPDKIVLLKGGEGINLSKFNNDV